MKQLAIITLIFSILLFGCLGGTSQKQPTPSDYSNNYTALPDGDIASIGSDLTNLSDDFSNLDISEQELNDALGG